MGSDRLDAGKRSEVELLAQYQARFPEVQITLVETPAAV